MTGKFYGIHSGVRMPWEYFARPTAGKQTCAFGLITRLLIENILQTAASKWHSQGHYLGPIFMTSLCAISTLHVLKLSLQAKRTWLKASASLPVFCRNDTRVCLHDYYDILLKLSFFLTVF